MKPQQDPPSSTEEEEEPLSREELIYWAEFACWTTLALTPFLYWVNGPAVSTDQFVVRTGLVVLAALGAVVLRAKKILAKRKTKS